MCLFLMQSTNNDLIHCCLNFTLAESFPSGQAHGVPNHKEATVHSALLLLHSYMYIPPSLLESSSDAHIYTCNSQLLLHFVWKNTKIEAVKISDDATAESWYCSMLSLTIKVKLDCSFMLRLQSLCRKLSAEIQLLLEIVSSKATLHQPCVHLECNYLPLPGTTGPFRQHLVNRIQFLLSWSDWGSVDRFEGL